MKQYELYTQSELERLETLSSVTGYDLKIDTDTTRVWLCSLSVADGGNYNNILIERLMGGMWREVHQYHSED